MSCLMRKENASFLASKAWRWSGVVKLKALGFERFDVYKIQVSNLEFLIALQVDIVSMELLHEVVTF